VQNKYQQLTYCFFSAYFTVLTRLSAEKWKNSSLAFQGQEIKERQLTEKGADIGMATAKLEYNSHFFF
jgi:hypothetical protein